MLHSLPWQTELNQKLSMTARLTRDEFVQNLSDSGLFSSDEFRKAVEIISEAQVPDGDSAAQHLIRAGRLTSFQAAAVCEGHHKGLVIGNYEICDRLGAGGMGTVYKARHRRMRRIVAIKILSREVAKSETFIKRFQREVEAVARLNHPNIVAAYDADEAEVGHFLVMEFVNGQDLASIVRDNGPMPLPEAIVCIIQAANALEYAHGQNIIHRDIKPANLLRDKTGTVKVADLGLARFEEARDTIAEETSPLTQAGTIMGTVDYMSPEQALGLADVDHRADIYSLGCTLYFLLIGKAPFAGSSVMATLMRHREAPIPVVAASCSECPPELDAVIRRMLAKQPDVRFQSMAEVVKALEAVGASIGTSPGIAAPVTSSRESAAQNLPTQINPMDQTIVEPKSSPSPALQSGDKTLLVPVAPKVLLAEPSRTQSSIIRKYLQDQGVVQVMISATGQQTLDAVRKERPDAVVSAMHFTDMTGVQLAERIRLECQPVAPGFVLISSEADSSEVESLSKCGNAVLLKKPFTPEQLTEALRFVCARESAGQSAKDRSGLQVLIVDDSAAARTHARHVLSGLGLTQIAEASDGAQAVATVAANKFHLIITDFNMPYMDGHSLISFLKHNPATAAIPVIMFTTEHDAAKLEAVRRSGAAAVCDKSLPAEVVEKVIAQIDAMS